MGLTLTAVPLVTELLMVVLPAVITPVPPENTAVRFELCPEVMVVGLAVKLVMVGGVLAVTVTVAVTAVPLVGVTVSV